MEKVLNDLTIYPIRFVMHPAGAFGVVPHGDVFLADGGAFAPLHTFFGRFLEGLVVDGGGDAFLAPLGHDEEDEKAEGHDPASPVKEFEPSQGMSLPLRWMRA